MINDQRTKECNFQLPLLNKTENDEHKISKRLKREDFLKASWSFRSKSNVCLEAKFAITQAIVKLFLPFYYIM